VSKTLTLTACSTPSNVYERLVGLTLKEPVDFMELYSMKAGATDPEVLATEGALCTHATDVPACKAAFAALDRTKGWAAGAGGRHYLLYTRGDTTGVVSTIEELRALLGPIDNLKDAALLITESLDHAITCPGSAAGVDGDGFIVLTSKDIEVVSPSCVRIENYVDGVGAGGVTSTRSTEPARRGTSCPPSY